jgi:nucleoside-diphosphate-sugar epimerase
MRVLVVGGSGYVAGLILPALTEAHTVRVLDPQPGPAGVDYEVDYRPGDATDPDVVRAATEGMDAVLHCAMAGADWDTPAGAVLAFDVHVTSVQVTLRAAHDAGIPHAVHVSSMSVYREVTARELDESARPDATDIYGLTKRLGEEVCAAAVAQWGLSVNVLRLAWPTPDDVWPLWGSRWAAEQPGPRRAADGRPIDGTAASDLGRAVCAALEYRDGFQAFTITGDRSARLWSTAKARQLLGWQPTFPRARS